MSSDFRLQREEGLRAEEEVKALADELHLEAKEAALAEAKTAAAVQSTAAAASAAEAAGEGTNLSEAVQDWRVGVSELREALSRAWAAEDARNEVQEGGEEDSILSVEVEDVVVAAVRGVLSTELFELRVRVQEELAQQAAAMTSHVADSAEAAAADLSTVRGELADVAGDGVELRRQLLALCDARNLVARPPAIVDETRPLRTLVAEAEGEEDDEKEEDSTMATLLSSTTGPNAHALTALRTRLERTEARQWGTLGEVRSRCTEVRDDLQRVRGEVGSLAARVDAGEQNASRGLVMLQTALEALRIEHAELRRSVLK